MFDDLNTGSSKRECGQFTSGVAYLKACVHDSTHISCPIFIKYARRFSLPKEQVLSVTKRSVLFEIVGIIWR